ncbi:unnamed protein product [Nesidiocoris tenuis]|uniref:Uncharacterized protein n=1 Tax=Nesidiocoris tenuis TaxID=355587 RepID=A0A6H5HSU6_9HEMI|nr:unnamed protein product [Nesidiocoris tenuis]
MNGFPQIKCTPTSIRQKFGSGILTKLGFCIRSAKDRSCPGRALPQRGNPN